jgi:hypothetical protein
MEDDQFPDAHKKILASIQYPIVGEAGKTGAWRTIRPIIQLDKCIVSQKINIIVIFVGFIVQKEPYPVQSLPK